MKLYYSTNTCSLAPHIVLREAALSFDLVRVDITNHRTQDGGNFYDVNAKGQVPVLELDDGSYLTEGPVIARYVADLVPRARLIPAAGTADRYRVEEWQNFITSEIHKSFTPLFQTSLPASAKSYFADGLMKKLAWIDAHLTDRNFLQGERFNVADAYLFVVTGWAPYVALDIGRLRHIAAYRDRVALRPAVRTALTAEGH